MGQTNFSGTTIDAKVLDFLLSERDKALSLREWKFRLAGYGYAIKEVMGRQVVTTLPHGIELGVMPAQA